MRKKKTKNSLTKFVCASEDKTNQTNQARMTLASECLTISKTLLKIAIKMLLTQLITNTRKTQI